MHPKTDNTKRKQLINPHQSPLHPSHRRRSRPRWRSRPETASRLGRPGPHHVPPVDRADGARVRGRRRRRQAAARQGDCPRDGAAARRRRCCCRGRPGRGAGAASGQLRWAVGWHHCKKEGKKFGGEGALLSKAVEELMLYEYIGKKCDTILDVHMAMYDSSDIQETVHLFARAISFQFFPQDMSTFDGNPYSPRTALCDILSREGAVVYVLPQTTRGEDKVRLLCWKDLSQIDEDRLAFVILGLEARLDRAYRYVSTYLGW